MENLSTIKCLTILTEFSRNTNVSLRNTNVGLRNTNVDLRNTNVGLRNTNVSLGKGAVLITLSFI